METVSICLLFDLYHPQRSWGKVMFSQACVILFTGGCLPQCMLGYHTPRADTAWSRHPLGADTPMGADTPLEQTPPRADTPQSRHPPVGRPPRADTPPEQTPLWEQTPPRADSPPGSRPPKQITPQSRHPRLLVGTPQSRHNLSRHPLGADTP